MPHSPWLVAVDFSPTSLAALRWTGAHLARPDTLLAVHVVDLPEPPAFLAPLLAPVAPARESAVTGARARFESLRADGLPTLATEVRAGRSAATLLAVAREQDAAAIVVGPHGARPGLGRLIGSTAARIALAADCPVVIARGDLTAPPRRVLVAVEDGEEALAALDWAARFVTERGIELVAVHVLDPALTGAVSMAAAPRERMSALAKLARASEAWLEARLEATSVPAAQRLPVMRTGDPVAEILAAVDTHAADLLVIGRGRRGLIGFGGHVTDALLRAAQVSTVVVP